MFHCPQFNAVFRPQFQHLLLIVHHRKERGFVLRGSWQTLSFSQSIIKIDPEILLAWSHSRPFHSHIHSYMQSGPSQVNQIDSPSSNPAAPITSSHHGRPLDQPDRIRDPRVEDHRGRSRHSSGSADASDLPRTSTVDPFAVNDGVRQLDLLTDGSKKSSSASLDSIMAYDDSLPPTLHRPVTELPSIVVGNLPSRDYGTSSMADLPNGMTCSLSCPFKLFANLKFDQRSSLTSCRICPRIRCRQ